MSHKYILTILLPIIFWAVCSAAAQTGSQNNCVTCHQEFEDDNGPSHLFSGDVHAQAGLGCEVCHGGDPRLDDMDDVRALPSFRGVPEVRDIPVFCGGCHGDAAYMHEHNPSLPVDQLEKYRTSKHGQLLFGSGDTNVATCVSCHGAHTITSARLPHSPTHPSNIPATCGACHADPEYMKGYAIGTSQLEDYAASVHGRAVLERGDYGAPACNDCHGNHGAAPPGVNSLSAVCGVCHSLESQLFSQSPHRDAFELGDLPACETCHGNHRIEKPHDDLVGMGDDALCGDCHGGDGGAEVANRLRALLDTLVLARQRADSTLAEATERGMMVTDIAFVMQEADQLQIKSRIAVHSLDTLGVAEKVLMGVAKADSVVARSVELVDEYYFRRKGAGVSTLLITVLAAALYWKIRTLDAKQR